MKTITVTENNPIRLDDCYIESISKILLENPTQPFRLENNQLINDLPESMCELDFNWSNTTFFNISNNQFSAPYPECIKKYITIRIPPFVFNR